MRSYAIGLCLLVLSFRVIGPAYGQAGSRFFYDWYKGETADFNKTISERNYQVHMKYPVIKTNDPQKYDSTLHNINWQIQSIISTALHSFVADIVALDKKTVQGGFHNLDITAEAVYFDNYVISMSFKRSDFLNGVNKDNVVKYSCLNFDLKTNREIKLADLLKDKKAGVSLILKELEAKIETEAGSLREEHTVRHFAVTKEGLLFFIDALCMIKPSSGSQRDCAPPKEVLISWEMLEAHLSTEWTERLQIPY